MHHDIGNYLRLIANINSRISSRWETKRCARRNREPCSARIHSFLRPTLAREAVRRPSTSGTADLFTKYRKSVLVSHLALKPSTICNNTTNRTCTCAVHSLEENVGSLQAWEMLHVSGSHYDLHDVVQFVQVRPAAGAGAQGRGPVGGQALQQIVRPHFRGALHAR